MDTAHIHKKLDSETIPELKPWIGKRVEIYVFESANAAPGSLRIPSPPFPAQAPKTVKQLAADQGVVLRPVEQMVGGWPAEELDDDFEKALGNWREREIEEELERRSKE